MLNCLRQAEAARGDMTGLSGAGFRRLRAEGGDCISGCAGPGAGGTDNLLEEFTRRREQNTQLEIYQDTWLELRSALTGYHTPADWSPIRNQLDECVRRCESVVQQKRIQADGALSALQKEYTELEYHLRQIKSQPEPVPPTESVQAARLQLMLRGVPAHRCMRSSIFPQRRLRRPGSFGGPAVGQRPAPWWYQKNICRQWKTCWRSIRIAFWFRPSRL